jgi:hypothetical protein
VEPKFGLVSRASMAVSKLFIALSPVERDGVDENVFIVLGRWTWSHRKKRC